MAAMDAAIFEALWCHTAQTKYTKPNYKGFQEYFFFTDFRSTEPKAHVMRF